MGGTAARADALKKTPLSLTRAALLPERRFTNLYALVQNQTRDRFDLEGNTSTAVLAGGLISICKNCCTICGIHRATPCAFKSYPSCLSSLPLL